MSGIVFSYAALLADDVSGLPSPLRENTDMSSPVSLGAIILCGGRSSRLGSDKALLPFGLETMLQRTVRILSSVVEMDRVVIVAAENQQLPPLNATVVRDREEYQGPLAAVTRGFEAMPARTDAVFVTGCDTPLLQGPIIEYLAGQLADYDAVVPKDQRQFHPLCAVYRSRVLRTASWQPSQSMHGWLEKLNVNIIAGEKLQEIDPRLDSLRNVNTREDYVAALAAAGLPTP